MQNLVEKLPTVARIALGSVFLLFGLNGFLHFLPQPPLPGAAVPFLSGLASASYFFPLLKGVEVISALLLLSNRFVPLALALLAPIVVNILFFHTFLAPSLPLPLFILALELYLAWSYRSVFAPMLAARAAPRAASTKRVREAAHV
jgi:hypothetical protein